MVSSVKKSNKAEGDRSKDPLLPIRDKTYTSPENKDDVTHTGDQQTGKILEKENCFNKLTSTLFHVRLGPILAAIAAVGFAVMGACMSIISKSLNPFQLGAMVLPCPILATSCLLITYRTPVPRKCNQLLLLLMSGVTVFGVFLCYTLAYEYLMLGDVTSIGQVSIILVGFVSWIVLKEPFRVVDFLLALMALFGVVFISRPSFVFGSDVNNEGINNLIGSVCALGAAFCSALTYVIVRKQSILEIQAFQSSFFNLVMSEMFHVLLCTVTNQWRIPTVQEWVFSQGAGIAYFIAQTTLYLALARESATFVNIIVTFQLVGAFIIELIIFKTVPQWTSVVGASFVIAACIGTVTIGRRPADEKSEQ